MFYVHARVYTYVEKLKDMEREKLRERRERGRERETYIECELFSILFKDILKKKIDIYT